MKGFISDRKGLYLVLCLIIDLKMKTYWFVNTNEMVVNGCLYDIIRLLKCGILVIIKPGVELELDGFRIGHVWETKRKEVCR